MPVRAQEQPIDASTAAGAAFLNMLGVFSDLETNLRRGRQPEGIAATKTRSVYAGEGRPAAFDPAEVRRLRCEESLRPSTIARRLEVERASIFRRRRGMPEGGAA